MNTLAKISTTGEDLIQKKLVVNPSILERINKFRIKVSSKNKNKDIAKQNDVLLHLLDKGLSSEGF